MPRQIPKAEKDVGIAYVSPVWPGSLVANGVATYTTCLVGALRAMGHRPHVIVLFENQGSDDGFVTGALPHPATRSWRGRLLDCLGYRLAPARWRALRLAAALRSRIGYLVREAGVQIVEMEEAFGRARQLAGCSPIPVVVRLHGPWFLVSESLGLTPDRTLRRRVRHEGLAIASAAGVSAPSEDVLRRVRAHYGLALADAEVIRNPVESPPISERWNRARYDRNLILFVGRFDRCKGADTMVDAFRRVAASCPSARLTFVGPDGKPAEGVGRSSTFNQYLTEHVADPAVRQRVNWLGLQSPECINELRRKAAVTVVCSRYEVFGYTALEAMAYGCPLIVTAVGGLRELVQDGHNGLLCEPGDPEGLADKTMTLLSNPGLAERLGRQAGIDAERDYAPKTIGRQTLEFYQRVMERAGSRQRGRRIRGIVP